MPPLARPTRPRQPWRRVASTSWRTAAAAAKAPRPKASSGDSPRSPKATQPTSVIRAVSAGHWSRWRSSSVDALRHGRAGATAMRNSRRRAIGIVMRSK